MDIDERIELITRNSTEEVLVEDELKELLETKDNPTHYIGFEVSGLLHIGTLILSGMKINDLIEAGVDCKIYLANWHSVINNKLGGSWENIKKASAYYEEAFKFFCPGVEIIHGDDLYHNNDEFWRDVVEFSKNVTLNRNTRCLTIMGREESEKLSMAQYFYPPMQAVDIKHIGADIAHGGMDQRNIHVLAREVFPKLGLKKPVCLHHHLLMGLQKPGEGETGRMDAKMSKSKPDTAIFVHDSKEEIERKMNKAWCPEKQAEDNPVLDYLKHLAFTTKDSVTIERPEKFGGDVEFEDYESLKDAYVKGDIHPADLKSLCAKEVNDVVDPVRSHFEKPKNKKLLEAYEEADVTR